jgi:recombination protein RecT
MAKTGAELAARLTTAPVAADPVKTIANLLETMRPQFAAALPSIMKPERLIRLAVTELRKNPKLMECSTPSFIGAIMQCAQTGLEPGIDGQAYLVPYKGECTFIIGYKGFVSLMYRNPKVKKVFANFVCENDQFEYSYGIDEKFNHKPAFQDRGDVIYYYAYVKLDGGESTYLVMSKPDVIAHARKYSPAYNRPGSPWQDDFDSMAMKTCLRQLERWIPKSVEFRDTASRDETVRTDIENDVYSSPITANSEVVGQRVDQDGIDNSQEPFVE